MTEAAGLAASENADKNESAVVAAAPPSNGGSSIEAKVSKNVEGSAEKKQAVKESPAAKAAAVQARNQSYVQKMLSLPKLVFTEQV
jgi:hypothetical protein